MSPTPIKDPNAPPDPNELAPIPDHQMAGTDWVGAPHNQVAPGAPPSPDYPTGVPGMLTAEPTTEPRTKPAIKETEATKKK